MTAAIYLKDRTGSMKGVPVENFSFNIDTDKLNTVKTRLRELQKGYCEGSVDRPRIGAIEIPREGKKPIKTIYAESEADFFYIAYLGMKIKDEHLPKKA